MSTINEHVVRWVRRVASPVLGSAPMPDASEIMVDATTNTLVFHSGGSKVVVDLSNAQAITGAKSFSATSTFTGATVGLRRSVTVDVTAAVTLTTAMSGLVYVSTATSGTQIFTLPLASAGAGLTYTVVCGHPDTEIHFAVSAGDRIVGKVSADTNAVGLLSTVTTGVVKNTAASNVLGDTMTLVSDGLLSWYVTAMTGVWEAT